MRPNDSHHLRGGRAPDGRTHNRREHHGLDHEVNRSSSNRSTWALPDVQLGIRKTTPGRGDPVVHEVDPRHALDQRPTRAKRCNSIPERHPTSRGCRGHGPCACPHAAEHACDLPLAFLSGEHGARRHRLRRPRAKSSCRDLDRGRSNVPDRAEPRSHCRPFVIPASGDRPLTLAFLGDPNSLHTRRWLAFFLDRGHVVHLILASDRPLTASLDERLVVHHVPPPSRSPMRFLGAVRTRRRLRTILSEAKVELLHAHYLTGYGWLARIATYHPYAITVWGSDVYVTPKVSLIARLWALVALRGADLVTADSLDLRRATIALGARPSRTRLIQFGVDTSQFRRMRTPKQSGLRSASKAAGSSSHRGRSRRSTGH